MMIKYKLNEVAKDLGLAPKDVAAALFEHSGAKAKRKNAQSTLTEDELNVIFECFTQKNTIDDVEAYLAKGAKAEEEAPAEVQPEEKPAEDKSEKQEKAEPAPAKQEKAEEKPQKQQKSLQSRSLQSLPRITARRGAALSTRERLS